MKTHVYLIPLSLLIGFSARAQVKKGDILLGGNIGFSSYNYNPGNPNNGPQENQTGVNVTPSVAWAIKDNLLEGFDLLYAGSNSTEKASSPTTYESSLDEHTYGAGFFLRKYKYLGAGFSVFAQGRLGGNYSNTKNTNYDGDGTQDNEKSYGISLGFYPGLAYAVSSRIQVEMGFQNLVAATYSNTKEDVLNPAGSVATTNKINSFSINTGLGGSLQSFALGIRVLLDHGHSGPGSHS